MSICARVFESERFTVSRVLKSFAADEREVETFFCNDFSLSLLCLSLSLPLFDEVMSTGARARACVILRLSILCSSVCVAIPSLAIFADCFSSLE